MLEAGENVEDKARCTVEVEVGKEDASLIGGTSQMDLLSDAARVVAGERFVLANV